MKLWFGIGFVFGSLTTFFALRAIFINRLKIERLEREEDMEKNRQKWEDFIKKVNHETMAPPASALGLWDLIEWRLTIVITDLSGLLEKKEWNTFEQINELIGLKYLEFKMLRHCIESWVEEKRKLLRENDSNQFKT